MRNRLALSLTLAALCLPATAGTFEVKGRDYLVDGKPLQILSGEIHYPRVPRA